LLLLLILLIGFNFLGTFSEHIVLGETIFVIVYSLYLARLLVWSVLRIFPRKKR
jgi:hypothetical protein